MAGVDAEDAAKALGFWGKHDLSFDLGEPGRYRNDVPNATVYVLEAGHFALDAKADETAAHTRLHGVAEVTAHLAAHGYERAPGPTATLPRRVSFDTGNRAFCLLLSAVSF